MDLTYNQVEAVFAQRFDLPKIKAVAFRGRLQHLQKLNFPTGVNTGRGKRASYGWKQIIQLMVGLDLIDFGMMPDVAAKCVRKNTDKLFTAISEVICNFEDPAPLAKALKKARCPFAKTQIVVASAYALSFPQADDEPALILTMSGKEFLEQLTMDPAVAPAAAFIDLGSRLMLVGQLVGRNTASDPIDVASDLLAWSIEWAGQDRLS